jgi:hypothetical protein
MPALRRWIGWLRGQRRRTNPRPTESRIVVIENTNLLPRSLPEPATEMLVCADVIYDFRGYLAQVKAMTVKDVDSIPDSVLGAAWGPQKERMAAATYFPLFLVLVSGRRHSIFYLSADLQASDMFKPDHLFLHAHAEPGWQGFIYDLGLVRGSFVRLR